VYVQVLRDVGSLPKARKDAMADACHAQEFVSHCAAEGADSVTPAKMTVAQLRAALLVHLSPPQLSLLHHSVAHFSTVHNYLF
jgi:hypothetical protein